MKQYVLIAGISILSMALLTLNTSCQNTNSSNSDAQGATNTVEEPTQDSSLSGQIMVVHEEAMRKIGKLRGLEKSIHKKIRTVTKKGADTTALSQIAKTLHKWDTTMFSWMQQYHDKITGKATDSIKKDYLSLQLQKVTHINNGMDSTIAQAKDHLK